MTNPSTEFIDRDDLISVVVDHLAGRPGIRFEVVDDSWERQFGNDGRYFTVVVADDRAISAIIPAQRGLGGTPSVGVFVVPKGWSADTDPNGERADPIAFYHFDGIGTGASVFESCRSAVEQAQAAEQHSSGRSGRSSRSRR